MDITNIPQTLIKGLEQKNTEQLVALSRVLNLVLGKTVIADVTSTAPVTEPERAELLKQTVAALAQINKQTLNQNNLTPAIKAEISRLLQQQNLIQSPALKWVNLVVNDRPLTTYSDRPLVAGQAIPVQLQSPQKLVLLNLPEFDVSKLQSGTNTATNLQTPETKNTAALNELLKITLTELTKKIDTIPNPAALKANLGNTTTANAATYAKDLSLKFSTRSENKNITPETHATKTLISEHLRNLLPHRDTPNVLLSAITQLQQLSAPSRLQLISPSLEQALKSLAAHIRLPEQLSQPKLLAQILKNSGVFFENKLNEAAQHNAINTASEAKAGNTLNHTYTHDLKGTLLTVINQLAQEISGDKKPLSSEQIQRLLQQVNKGPLFNPASVGANTLANKNDIAQAIGVFIQQLMYKPVKELSDKEIRTQLLILLQQHSVHSLAKIQLQQLHTINHELETKDSTSPSASWQLEIPVKHHNDIQHLHLRIDRDWVDDKNESESHSEKNSNKVKQWSVTLRFDLPTLGEFCAQLAIINTQVSATLWAEREYTFIQVRDQVEGLRKQLENEGINVKYLQCMRGIPPEKPMALSYSLIDIST